MKNYIIVEGNYLFESKYPLLAHMWLWGPGGQMNLKSIPGHGSMPAIFFLICGILVTVAVLVIFGVIPVHQSASLSKGSSVNLTVGGSTTIQPISELLAREYMASHDDIQIHVVGGGSGAGVSNTVNGRFEIGAISRPLEDSEKKNYPALTTYQIGGSAIVVIASLDYPSDQVTYAELQEIYDSKSDDLRDQTNLRNVLAAVQRSDASGTEEVFAQWLFGKQAKNLTSALNTNDISQKGSVHHITADGNNGIVDAVKKNSGSIGFVDFGYAEGNTGIKILKIVDNGSSVALPTNISDIHDAVLFELSHQDDNNSEYIEKLTRPLSYIVLGMPSADEEAFLSYSQSVGVTKYFHEIGYFSLSDITRGNGTYSGS